VSDELLHLLYRSGAAAPRLTATLHDWFDFGALLAAVPESARGAGFGVARSRPAGMNPFLNPGVADALGKWTQLFFPAVAVVDGGAGALLVVSRRRAAVRILAGFPPASLPVSSPRLGPTATVRMRFYRSRDDLPHLLGTDAIETRNSGQLSDSG
jgi:hypothetical protein